MSRLKICCFGEPMVELSLSASDPGIAKIGFAGDTLNTAIYLKRSAGAGIDVSYVTALGTDSFSDDMIAFMQAEGLQTDRIGRNADRSVGLYAITTDDSGERSFAYWRDTSAARAMFGEGDTTDFDALEGFSVLYFSAITLAILPVDVCKNLLDWLRSWRQRTGGKVAFDSNYRPRLWPSPEFAKEMIANAWKVCDIALPTVDDEMAIFGDRDTSAVLDRLRGYGVAQGALKCGASGPVSISPMTAELSFSPAETVVDTTAAGDSFNGGYLAALLSGQTQEQALLAGHEQASRVIGIRGAIIPAD